MMNLQKVGFSKIGSQVFVFPKIIELSEPYILPSSSGDSIQKLYSPVFCITNQFIKFQRNRIKIAP